MTDKKRVKFQMVQINVEQFAILKPSLPSDGEFKFGFALDFKTSPGETIVAPVVKMVFADKEKGPFVILDVLCAFEFDENSWSTFTQKDKSVVIPREFLCRMIAHTVGTARGIMHCKTESTIFNGLIIPVVNVEKAIETDLVIHPE